MDVKVSNQATGSRHQLKRTIDSCSGQSVLEFCLMFPLLLGFTGMLLRFNTAIQISIVNQQYARIQALFLTYKSPDFPRLGLRHWLTEPLKNRLVVGVADNSFLDPSASKIAEPTIQNISSVKNAGSDENQTEPELRSRVRIRDTVALCTGPHVIGVRGGGWVPALPLNGKYEAEGSYAPSDDNIAFDFCRNPFDSK